MITPVAIESIGYKYYIVYTVIGFCIPLSVFFLYPEVSIQKTTHQLCFIIMNECANGQTPHPKKRPWACDSRISI